MPFISPADQFKPLSSSALQRWTAPSRISWRGGGKADRIQRNHCFQAMTPLLQRSDCRFVSLQYGDDGLTLSVTEKPVALVCSMVTTSTLCRTWMVGWSSSSNGCGYKHCQHHRAWCGGSWYTCICLVSSKAIGAGLILKFSKVVTGINGGCFLSKNKNNWQPALNEAANWLDRHL